MNHKYRHFGSHWDQSVYLYLKIISIAIDKSLHLEQYP